MPSVLDQILIKDLITSPTTVNTDYKSEAIDISDKENEFSIQVDYDGGVTVNMEVSLEVSNDKVTYVPITESAHTITDDTGTSFFDLSGSGSNYIRVSIIVTTGSIDLQQILYKGFRRH